MAGIEVATGALMPKIGNPIITKLNSVLLNVFKRRCEYIREGRYANDPPFTVKAMKHFQCKHNASYKIHGKLLCTKHASKVALDILLNLKLVTK